MASPNKTSVFSLAYFRHFIKFSIVGAIGVAVNEGLLILFYRSMGIYLLTASAAAIEVSILSNFVLNDLWTFRDRRSGNAVVRLVKFNVLMLAGLVLNLAILYAGVDYAGMTPEIANLIGIAAAFLLRYALSVKYAWMRVESVEKGEPTPIREPLSGPKTAGG